MTPIIITHPKEITHPLKGCSQPTFEYLERNRFLSSQQFGFRRNRSTSSAVVYFTVIVRKSMDRDQLTGALFVDLKKAFDTVDHSILISKLPLYGIEHAEQI